MVTYYVNRLALFFNSSHQLPKGTSTLFIQELLDIFQSIAKWNKESRMMDRKWVFLGILAITLLLASCERPSARVENPNVSDNSATLPTVAPTTAPATGDNSTTEEVAEPQTPTEVPVESPSDDGSSDDASAGDDTTAGDDANQDGTTDSGDDSGDASTDDDADNSGGDDNSGDENTETGDDNADDSDSTDSDANEGDGTDENTDSTPTTPTEHVVQAGENLYRIGLAYNLSFLQIAEANNIAAPYNIIVGQTLTIPGSGDTDNSNEGEGEETTYTVKAGDTLYSIGVAQGVSWVQIAEANGLSDPNRISPGDTLKIPVSTPGPTPQFSHTVKTNETLYSIAVQYGVSWTAVAADNNISSPYIIFPGSVLKIPSSN